MSIPISPTTNSSCRSIPHSPIDSSDEQQETEDLSHLLITNFMAPCTRECIQTQTEFMECKKCKSSLCIGCYGSLLKRLKIKMKQYHFSQRLYYICHGCLNVSPTLGFRYLNQQRIKYINTQAYDPINWIFDAMRFIELNEAENHVLIKGHQFPLECFDFKSTVSLSENGAIVVKHSHSKQFHESMGFKSRPLSHYGSASETNMNYSLDIDEELIMLQIKYTFAVAIALLNFKNDPMGPKNMPRFKQEGLDTNCSHIIEDYKIICDNARDQFENAFF